MRRSPFAVLALSLCLPLGLSLGLAGCPGPEGGTDTGPVGTDTGRRDTGTGTDAPVAMVDAGPEQEVSAGDVMGDWCGGIHVTGAITVPVGQTLTVCAGAQVRIDAGVSITVNGTLEIDGTSAARVRFFSAGSWAGITVAGTVNGTFVAFTNATTTFTGSGASDITLEDSSLTAASSGAPIVSLANGARFDRTSLIGGNTIPITGGMLSMTDSVIDQMMPPASPDCTDWAGGGMTLDHVRVTGCHCPIHINSADLPVTITNSILDGAKNPIMIADCTAEIHHNNLSGTSTLILDIGNRSDPRITADVSDNYWDGGPANVGTSNPSQFTGTSMLSMTPFTDVGPR